MTAPSEIAKLNRRSPWFDGRPCNELYPSRFETSAEWAHLAVPRRTKRLLTMNLF